MKAIIKYLGYDEDRKNKINIIAQGHIIKETEKQLVLSINGTTATIRKKDILFKKYIEDFEEIYYARI